MDTIDKKILFILQRQSDLAISEIAKRVGLSQTPCWNRIKKLEEDGTIQRKTIIINKRKVKLPVTIFLIITVRNHNENWMKKFHEILKKYNNILEAHKITGPKADYLVKIIAESVEDYNNFQQILIKEIEVNSMSSSISLQELKNTTILPIR